MKEERHQRNVRMGIGEAILRLMKVNHQLSSGLARVPEEHLAERDLIVKALNQYTLDLGFDCNDTPVPTTVEVFEKTVATSCCRMLPFKSDRLAASPHGAISSRRKS